MSYIDNARAFLLTIANELDSLHGLSSVYRYKTVIRMYNEEHNTNYVIKNGAVRVVIIGEDFVIKVDYDKTSAKEFGGCESEYKFWRNIKDTDHAFMFAPITKVKAGHHYYYVMPRMDCLGCEMTDVLEDYLSEDDEYWLYDTVGDLHEANYGVLNNELYIIDYACRAH